MDMVAAGHSDKQRVGPADQATQLPARSAVPLVPDRRVRGALNRSRAGECYRVRRRPSPWLSKWLSQGASPTRRDAPRSETSDTSRR